jgi:hypothetical protein
MRFTPTGADNSIEETKTRLTFFMEHQGARGFGKLLVADRTSGIAIGDSGLLVLEEYGWIDLGFRFVQEAQEITDIFQAGEGITTQRTGRIPGISRPYRIKLLTGRNFFSDLVVAAKSHGVVALCELRNGFVDSAFLRTPPADLKYVVSKPIS